MSEARRVRIFKVSRELIQKALLLPEGSEIVGVSADLHFDQDCWAIKVESPDFAPLAAAQKIPEVGPVYRSRNGKPEFVGWKE